MRKPVRQFKEMVDIRSSVLNRLRSNRFFPYIVLAAAFLTAACIHIWQRVHVLELVTDVSGLTAESVALEDKLKKVKSDISRLSMASRIESYAIDTLGMQEVPAERLYTLVPSGSVGYKKDELKSMLSAIRRIVDHIPTPSENSALAGEPSIIRIDSTDRSEMGR